MRAPAVYQFVCPDGRVYVGSRANVLARKREGITATNSRLAAALVVYPAETWTFKVLEQLPGGCSKAIRLRAEQQHILRGGPLSAGVVSVRREVGWSCVPWMESADV